MAVALSLFGLASVSGLTPIQGVNAEFGVGAKPVLTNEQQDYIEGLLANGEHLSVGTIPNRRPLSYSTGSSPVGIIPVIVDYIVDLTGLPLEMTEMAAGVTGKAGLEQFDLVAGVLQSTYWSDDPDYVTADTILESSLVMVGRNGEAVDISSNLTIVTVSSFKAMEAYIQASYPQFTIIYDTKTADCLVDVQNHKADVFIQNEYIISYYLSDPHYDDLKIVPQYHLTEQDTIAAKASLNPLAMEIINLAIAAFDSSYVEQIVINNTIANPYKLTFNDFVYKYRSFVIAVGALSLVLALCIIAILIINRRNNRAMSIKNMELQGAVNKAREASSAKSMFLARMSHEIRTPMNAIVGYASLAEQETDPEKSEEYLERILSSSKVLLSLINDILDMSSIENDKMKLSCQPFSISETIHGVSDMYDLLCQGKGVAFSVELDVPDDHLYGDQKRVNQILLNLVSNAFKFTDKGGSILLSAKETKKENGTVYVEFVVADTGIGMSEDKLEKVFEPFDQESADTAVKYGGIGLGLSIAKNLVEMMDGFISVKSKKGQGTTFTMDIPFMISDKEPVTVSPEKKVYDFKGKKVLLAEDNAINKELAKKLLQSVHLDPIVASDGLEALEMYKEAKDTLSLVILDIQMPNMNGCECAKAIRALGDDKSKSIPIIAMTANAMTSDVSEALSSGMNDHISKPLDINTMFATIAKYID